MADQTIVEALRQVPVFSDFASEQLEWLVEIGEYRELQPGDIVFQEGQPATELCVILEGELQARRESDSRDSFVYIARAGYVTGKLPDSRMIQYGATGRAVLPSRILLFSTDLFPQMLGRIPVLRERLIGVMSDRIRETAMADQQRDKLMSLGKLSAGLAHELNNPAAAAERGAAQLLEIWQHLPKLALKLIKACQEPEQLIFLRDFQRRAAQQIISSLNSNQMDPLAQSDCEDEVSTWLDENHVADAWKLAPTLVRSGITTAELSELKGNLTPESLENAIKWLEATLTGTELLEDIRHSASRIVDLVKAVKEYSYMDQAPIQEVDIHRSIENTLTMLGHKLKKRFEVVRDYDANLPHISAYGSELNQVWTNLIDNATDAMEESGTLTIRTRLENSHILVEIGDTGPGIPPDIQRKIFDPFFTTKGVGKGTGLGLDAVYRIVLKHHGDIRVESKPGDTRFQIHLPIRQP